MPAPAPPSHRDTHMAMECLNPVLALEVRVLSFILIGCSLKPTALGSLCQLHPHRDSGGPLLLSHHPRSAGAVSTAGPSKQRFSSEQRRTKCSLWTWLKTRSWGAEPTQRGEAVGPAQPSRPLKGTGLCGHRSPGWTCNQGTQPLSSNNALRKDSCATRLACAERAHVSGQELKAVRVRNSERI